MAVSRVSSQHLPTYPPSKWSLPFSKPGEKARRILVILFAFDKTNTTKKPLAATITLSVGVQHVFTQLLSISLPGCSSGTVSCDHRKLPPSRREHMVPTLCRCVCGWEGSLCSPEYLSLPRDCPPRETPKENQVRCKHASPWQSRPSESISQDPRIPSQACGSPKGPLRPLLTFHSALTAGLSPVFRPLSCSASEMLLGCPSITSPASQDQPSLPTTCLPSSDPPRLHGSAS